MEIRLLGPVEVQNGDAPLHLGGPKQRAVLAMLALKPNASVSTDRLIEGLWGESQPATATKMVQLYVSQLRKLLAQDGGSEILTRGRVVRVACRSRTGGRGPVRAPCRGTGRAGRARALARAAAGRSRRAVHGCRGSPARGTPPRRARTGDRSRPGGRPSHRVNRAARRPGRRTSPERAPSRPADARAVPRRAAGRGARGLSLRARRPHRRDRGRTRARATTAAGGGPAAGPGARPGNPERRMGDARNGRARRRSGGSGGGCAGASCGTSSPSWPRTSWICISCGPRATAPDGGDVGGEPICPFKGLATFEVADADYFFGRERLVAEIVARLAGTTLLGLVGPSGSGKSSTLRAGLLPALAGGVLPGSEAWRQVVLRPGEHSLAELERALDGVGGDERLLLAVDQFEELFTSPGDHEQRVSYMDALVRAAHRSDGRVVIVLAVRADYYGACAAHPGLARLLGESHVLVGAMRRGELAQAIAEPARKVGVVVERELVTKLVDDVAGQAGGLPLLSTSLLELWQRREGRLMRLAAYERTGGVDGAVARLAEDAYGRLSEDEQRTARRILLRLAGSEEARGGCAPARSARRARSPARRAGGPRARSADGEPLGHGGRGDSRGCARGPVARMAAAPRLARGGHRGEAPPPPHHTRGGRMEWRCA